jgi:GNAT superfamily N-acetyltransferase
VTTPDITIRAYAPADLDACRGLWRELTQRHRDIYDDQTIGGEDPGPYFDETHLRDPRRCATWLAELDGAVVGMYSLLHVEGEDEAEIDPVVVRTELRSQGIGTKLLAHGIAEARSRGARTLSIRPVARNVEAIELYHEVGFRLLGHLDMFMELTPGRPWTPGVTIHGKEFRY